MNAFWRKVAVLPRRAQPPPSSATAESNKMVLFMSEFPCLLYKYNFSLRPFNRNLAGNKKPR